MNETADGFHGTSRFVLECQLGAGGMGIVHRVRDLERGETVALKTMARAEPSTLLRFKREFRALADISHPNVVQLYELFSEDDRWFFTMELVDGTDLLTWVGAPSEPPSLADPALSTIIAQPTFRPIATPSEPAPPSHRSSFAVRDADRLRDAVRQLASGLGAIHAAGKLHRDIKPSNVMVTRDGRVVLLDFGVVTDVQPRSGPQAIPEPLAGTPAYISPEQTALEHATPASDWYAVGVMLYEALTGRLPFEGHPLSVMFAKRQGPPPPPSVHADGIPPDLEQLTMELLERHPSARPTAEDVLASLTVSTKALDLGGTKRTTDPELGSLRAPFVGRQRELTLLHEAWASSARGPSVVMLYGSSGIGKSALATRFLEEIAGPDVVILSGRCYEREAVPFKAIDPIVDELRRWLALLVPSEVEGYLPEDLEALARVFPVLGDLGPPRESRASGEPEELRRRAFRALAELLSLVARRYRLVVHVDDLQWCDRDSIQLLDALFSTTPWPWLFLCSYRSELAFAAVFDLRALVARLGARAAFCEVEVQELSDVEAQDLARQLVGTGDIDTAKLVTREARGNPLFVAELARWAKEQAPSQGQGLSLEQVILDRVARLPDDARLLVETLAVARGPLAHAIAAGAAELDTKKRAPALLLRAARLVTMRGLDADDPIELAHDRVRETVARSLDAERRRACHAGIARELAAAERSDPEEVFEHFRAAGDTTRARSWALPAARAADRALAFSRAADLYEAAIALRAGAPAELHHRLGDALLHAGNLARAAEAYHAGARHAETDATRRELLRCAAESYLKSGHEARGLEVLRSVLDEVGLVYPEGVGRAIGSLVWNDAVARVRMLRVRPHANAADLERIDVAFAASTGLGLTDPLRSASFAARGLSLALAAGEPRRLCRALAAGASNSAARGEPGRARAEALVEEADRIARTVDEPHELGLALFAAGAVHFFLGEWRSARTKLERAERTFVEGCRGVAWELANTRAWICNVLILSGELAEARRRVLPLLDEARARDDRFLLVHLAYPACCANVVVDDVAGARTAIAATAEKQGRSPHVFLGSAQPHERGATGAGQWAGLISACSVERYCGEGGRAFERVESDWAELARSPLMNAAMIRVFSAYEGGLSAIAAAERGSHRHRALRAATRWAKELSKDKLRFAPALGLLLDAGIAAVRGDRRAADAALGAAIPLLDAADLGYLAACARHRKGELSSGGAGRELVERSRAFFAAQGVRRVDRCLAMSSPGFA